jgi:ubiquinone/menaquinone biosynthesis C-methylase UbiE
VQGKVLAVERDQRALRDLRRVAAQSSGMIEAIEGDLLQLGAISVLKQNQLAGALFANVLHFFATPDIILSDVRRFLQPDATIIIIEYDRRSASRWVPYPLSFQRLVALAKQAGLSAPKEIGRRASRYQGELYCAVVQR